MRRLSRLILLLLCALPSAANALPQRTFVASNGADTNSCSLAAPCRSFGTAVAAVADHGEVIVLDSAGYGAVTITKSVSIIASPGVYAGISVFSGAGITVDGSGTLVVLRGLSINNQGGTGPHGLDFLQGGILHIENCVISGFAPGGIGINVAAPGTITHVLDTVVRDNQEGIVFQGDARGNISRTRVERNVFLGISVTENAKVAVEDSVASENGYNIDVNDGFLAGATASATVARTLLSGGSLGIYAGSGGTSSVVNVTVMDSTISRAAVSGIESSAGVGSTARVTALRNQLQGNIYALRSTGAGASLILDGNALTGNGTGIESLNGATIVTRGNNTVYSNGTDTLGTPYTSLGGI